MADGNLFPYTGEITFADPSYNSTTGTFLLRATVNNPAGVLRPNQYVRVRVTGSIRPNAVLVPQRAVQQSAKGHFVWVVDAKGNAELRPVLVGDWKGEGWLISDGLTDGDKVVVDGGIRLAAGAPVKASPYVPAIAPATGARSNAPGTVSPAATASSVAVYFPKGAATLDTDALRTLRTAAAAYVGIGTQINVTGYADKSGNPAANIDLAKRRAAAVRDELVHLGVLPRRIQLVPPVNVTGTGSDDRARRVDLSVTQ
jgi:membrane fusion protein (multidrug efflux system)